MYNQTFLVVLTILSQVQSARILGVFFFPSISHQIVFQPIWRELSLRGHNVTVFATNPLKDASLVNLTEIDVSESYEFWKNTSIEKMFSHNLNKLELLRNVYKMVEAVSDPLLNNCKFQEIIHDKNQEYDVILMEHHNAIFYGLTAKFNAPIVAISSLGINIVDYHAIGNPCHPVLYPDLMLNYSNEMSFLEKIQSTIFSVIHQLYYHFIALPHLDQVARQYFGNDMPYLGDLRKNISLFMLSVNPILFRPRPNVPAIIELNQLHIKPVKPLPEDLQTILDESGGVIYVSLGSNVKSVNIPDSLKENMIEAFRELPYKVLWKWESDYLPNKPSNVITRKWLPQQDILAHPNIKAFLTQGGLQSLEEAISRGVPLIGMPFIGDQHLNVQNVIKHEIGLGVNPNTVTKDELKRAIIEVAENGKYRRNMEEFQDLLQDQPMKSLDKAVWWIEYVIRHKGAKHLRSPTADLAWYQFFLLDIIAVVVGLPILAFYSVLRILRRSKVWAKVKIN